MHEQEQHHDHAHGATPMEELTAMLGNWEGCCVTYAGGVHSYEDLELLRRLGRNRVNVTVGSALDLFGGSLAWKRVLEICGSVTGVH